MAEKGKNRWARTPNDAMRESLKTQGPRANYWVYGKDGKRRGPAPLDKDGVKRMEALGATCVPLKQGEFWTTTIRKET